ncbi:hypothetical protein MJD09_19220 [bacterium]|nr:hypothetical protein [bacterium]
MRRCYVYAQDPIGLSCLYRVPTAGFCRFRERHGNDSEIDIPFEKFVLKNRLTLVVHEDYKAPIVVINMWYHVGSKNEKLARRALPICSNG